MSRGSRIFVGLAVAGLLPACTSARVAPAWPRRHAAVPELAPSDAAPAVPEAHVAAPPREGLPQNTLTRAAGRKAYAPVRVSAQPVVDGALDEAIWRKAPQDGRFVNPKSEPHGLPSRQPTAFQVAYDAERLYVAIRCWDPDPGDHDDSIALDEEQIAGVAESVTVMIDPRHDRAHARWFTVAKSGDRADADVDDDGLRVHHEWRGEWDSAVRAKPSYWTAEIAIPWYTLDVAPGGGPVDLGLEVQRHIPSAGGAVAVWSLAPASYLASPPPSFFGDLVGISGVSPPPRLYLRPYLTVGGRLPPDRSTVGRLPLSRLRNFASDSDEVLLYGGVDGRVRPYGPVEIDFAINPDFAQVSPDAVVANLDRFEPSFPEVRPFFAEDETRLELGVPGAELFDSRRIGLRPMGTTRFEEVPILYAVKARAEHEGTYAAAMNVGLAQPSSRVSLDDEDTVARLSHDFGGGTRVGTIFLHRRGDFNAHMATGVDGAVAFMDEHLVLSGFTARTQTDGRDSGGAANAGLRWASRELRAEASYLDVSGDFDPQLGFFPLTGIRSGRFSVGYNPQVRNDYVGVLALQASLDRTRDRDERLVYDRAIVGATGILLNAATIAVRVRPSVEGVTDGFKIAGGRILVSPGEYDQTLIEVEVRSPPRRRLEIGAGYAEGELWDGYQRRPWLELGANLGRVTGAGRYELLRLRAGGQAITAHLVSARALYAPWPRLRGSLDVQLNSLDPRAAVHFTGIYAFGALSTAALVLSQSADTVGLFSSDPDRRAMLSLAYGISPF